MNLKLEGIVIAIVSMDYLNKLHVIETNE